MEKASSSPPVALVHPVPAVVANGSTCHPVTPIAQPSPVPEPREDGAPVGYTEPEEVLVDSQPILFNENPFILANKKRPGCVGIALGGPPTGYGSSGVLKTTVYSKKASNTFTPSSDLPETANRGVPGSPSAQQVSDWQPNQRRLPVSLIDSTVSSTFSADYLSLNWISTVSRPNHAQITCLLWIQLMKSLEQDALKAQMMIAHSKENRKRSTLDQLVESPSPAPTPSPTPLEDYSPRLLTSPGRLSPDLVPSVKYTEDSRTSVTCSLEHLDQRRQEEHGESDPPPTPNTTALEEMANYSNKRKLRHTRRSLESAAVPT
ncbi:hypothetical protein GDO86_018230 [Hymenochirus boettgeri]|uniref:Uncharacterized protein n=1 Tax=Hymenochirus boettgeri TaxID=247094 RepID=A0A8T2IDY4_9PIPI|nr:hypothetical protein GDO86_018230 [Hymenochirus boettgeri]